LDAEDLPSDLALQLCALRGGAQREIGRTDDALATLLQATRQATPSPELLYQLAEIQIEAGELQAARQTLRATLARHGQHGPSRALLARLETAPEVARQTDAARPKDRQNR
jgi:thioredoxin-like negative regulator of GroEL